MEILEAMIKSIRTYYEGNAFEASSKLKEVKYTKDYFDSFEQDMMGDSETTEPMEGKVDPKKQETLKGIMQSTEKVPMEQGDMNAESTE